jgi:hypothetical protein
VNLDYAERSEEVPFKTSGNDTALHPDFERPMSDEGLSPMPHPGARRRPIQLSQHDHPPRLMSTSVAEPGEVHAWSD